MENQENTQSAGRRTIKQEPKKKKGKKIALFAGAVALAGAIAVEGFTNFLGIRDKVLNLLPKGGVDKNLASISEMLPLDEEGIISITFPVVDRTLGNPEGYYSLPKGYEPYYVGQEGEQVNLTLAGDSTTTTSVDNYTAEGGLPVAGYIGLQEEYAYYLNQVEDMKAKIVARDETVTSSLHPIKQEVPDLYLLDAGYQLYCDNDSLLSLAKVAEVHEDGSTVYSIPAQHVDKFVGVSNDICDLIVKYDTLKGQIEDIYVSYSNGNGLENGTENNLGR